MNFFLYYPFYNTKYNTNDSVYKQYLLMRKIVNFIMAKEIHVYDIDQFNNDVKELIKLNFENGLSYYLKVHHLTHYSELMLQFGPLSNYSTLRFERYHQQGKRSVRNSESKINLAYQISKAYIKKIESYDSDNNIVLINLKSSCILSEIDKNYLSYIDLNTDCILYESIYCDRVKYKINNVYLLKYKDDSSQRYPIFFYIDYIIEQNNRIKILGRPLQTLTFDRSKYRYTVKFINRYLLLDSNFQHYKSLNLFKENNYYYVSKTFYIPFEYCNYNI